MNEQAGLRRQAAEGADGPHGAARRPDAPHRGVLGTPPAEVTVSTELVRRLLVEQHPDLASAHLEIAASGWDNVTIRLGADLAVRLPRRAVGVPLLRHEQRWLPRLAELVPLPVPAPVRIGEPGAGYPWPWSVVPWLEGTTADLATPNPSEVAVLARFLRALHAPAPPDAPVNPTRGVPLAACAEAFARRLDQVAEEVDAEAVRAVFEAGATARVGGTRVWLHGDLHPRNVLVDGGRLAAVIDWGDLCAGDPATDLAVLWMLFDPAVHGAFWAAYGQQEPSLLARTRGWAALLGTALLAAGSHDDPRLATIGRRTLTRLLDATSGYHIRVGRH